MGVEGGETDRQRQTDTEKDRETERDKDRETETEGDRDRQTDKTTVYFLRPPAPGKGRTLYIIISSIHK